MRRIRVMGLPKEVHQSTMNTPPFASMISGAFGYVKAHYIEQCAVSVQLLNGMMLHSVAVPSREWVCDIDSSTSTGGIDIPPIGSLVFVLFPYGMSNTAGAMILGSFFDYRNDKHKKFLIEGDEDKAIKVFPGNLKTTYDRTDKIFSVEDVDDAKLLIQLDKKNKKLIVTDWNDNKLTLDSDGVTMEGKGNTVTLETGKATINGNLEVLQ